MSCATTGSICWRAKSSGAARANALNSPMSNLSDPTLFLQILRSDPSCKQTNISCFVFVAIAHMLILESFFKHALKSLIQFETFENLGQTHTHLSLMAFARWVRSIWFWVVLKFFYLTADYFQILHMFQKFQMNSVSHSENMFIFFIVFPFLVFPEYPWTLWNLTNLIKPEEQLTSPWHPKLSKQVFSWLRSSWALLTRSGHCLPMIDIKVAMHGWKSWNVKPSASFHICFPFVGGRAVTEALFDYLLSAHTREQFLPLERRKMHFVHVFHFPQRTPLFHSKKVREHKRLFAYSKKNNKKTKKEKAGDVARSAPSENRMKRLLTANMTQCFLTLDELLCSQNAVHQTSWQNNCSQHSSLVGNRRPSSTVRWKSEMEKVLFVFSTSSHFR